MPGNIVGCFIFLALYYLLPPSIYNYVGVIGGIGVGLSATYGCQAVFNTFGALAIATSAYGLKSAVGLRVAQNMFGVVFALLFVQAYCDLSLPDYTSRIVDTGIQQGGIESPCRKRYARARWMPSRF